MSPVSQDAARSNRAASLVLKVRFFRGTRLALFLDDATVGAGGYCGGSRAAEHLACHAGGHALKGKLKTKGTHLAYTAA